MPKRIRTKRLYKRSNISTGRRNRSFDEIYISIIFKYICNWKMVKRQIGQLNRILESGKGDTIKRQMDWQSNQ